MVLERTMKEQTTNQGLQGGAIEHELRLKNTGLEHKLQMAQRQIAERDGELIIAHNKHKRTAETQALTREALEAIRKQQDLGMQTLGQMEAQNKALQKQKSDLQKKCTDLEIKLEAFEIQFDETVKRLVARMNGTPQQAQGVRGQHRNQRRSLERALQRCAELQAQIRMLTEELHRREGDEGSSGIKSKIRGGEDPWKQVENRDRLIMAIKKEYEKVVARNQELERSRPQGANEYENLMEKLSVDIKRYMDNVKGKQQKIKDLEGALKREMDAHRRTQAQLTAMNGY